MKIKALVKSAALAALVTLPASAQATTLTSLCNVKEVYAFSNRVHVKCGKIDWSYFEYFAVPTSNSGEAARFTTMASMALGDWLVMDFDDDDTSGQSFGCQPNDCRRPLTFYRWAID